MHSRFAWFMAGAFSGAVGLYIIQWNGGVFAPYMAQIRSGTSAVPPPADNLLGPQTSTQDFGQSASSPPRVPSGAIVAPIENLRAPDIRDTFSQPRPGGRIHEAADIMEPRGTPVHAMVDGVIEKLFLSKPGGNTIYEFDDAQQYCYYYAHLDRYADGIQEKQHVSRGTVIGYVGSTGDASDNAPHLHLAINLIGPDKKWWKGTPINPYPILLKVSGQNGP